MNETMKLTSEGNLLVKAWKSHERHVKNLEAQLLRANIDLEETKNKLGKWLMPPTPRVGEEIVVWYVDSLIKAIYISEDKYEVSLRYRGREWDIV